MIKVSLKFLIILAFSNCIWTQGEYDNCYFGTTGLDLGGYSPFVLVDSGMEAKESAASISDSQGNLLFYSNGGNSPTVPGITGAIWNKDHQIMDNGVLGDSSGCISTFQGAIAIPSPSNLDQKKIGSNNYYLLTRDCLESSFSSPNYNSGLTYCLIDMDANNGLGRVIEKNQVVTPFSDGGSSLKTSHEPISAVRNQNNIDWWIFSYNNDSLYSLELSNVGFQNYRSYDLSEGEINISPRRDKLISGNKLYDFNSSNGELNYLVSLEVGSASFSPDGSKLYVLFENDIICYGMDAVNIENSALLVGTVNEINRIYLAPDSRIYLLRNNSNLIPGYIECPNNNISDVSIILDPVYLNGMESGTGFTNIPACYLYNTTTTCNVGLEKLNNRSENILITPNPATSKILISSFSPHKVESIKISDAKGKIVYSITEGLNNPIDIDHLQSGVYIVHLCYNELIATKKLLVK